MISLIPFDIHMNDGSFKIGKHVGVYQVNDSYESKKEIMFDAYYQAADWFYFEYEIFALCNGEIPIIQLFLDANRCQGSMWKVLFNTLDDAIRKYERNEDYPGIIYAPKILEWEFNKY